MFWVCSQMSFLFAVFSVSWSFWRLFRPTRMRVPSDAVNSMGGSNDSVVVGFAGGVADAFTLCERFEAKLTMYGGSLRRAAVALAQDWRSDKVMRKLEALLICANASDLLIVSGTGEVIEPDDGIAAIGSGGMYALAAARALKENTELPAVEIAEKALRIASGICVYTNSNIVTEEV